MRKFYPSVEVIVFLGVLLLGTISCFLYRVSLTDLPLTGDQASHLLQALSLANDFDLDFDTTDLEAWRSLEWSENPDGLFFQEYRGGYAFAKPYGYSVYLAPFVFLLGGDYGPLLANVILLAVLSAVCVDVFKQRYPSYLSLLLSFALIFASYVYFYTFTIHPDLFLATLVALFSLLVQKSIGGASRAAYPLLLGGLTAVLLAEKITMLMVLGPVIAFWLYKGNRRRLVTFSTVFFVSAALLSLPYLYYSDWDSWNPYSGKRFYSTFSVPFSENYDPGGFNLVGTSRFFSLEFVFESLRSPDGLKERALSLYYYFFGSLTGLLVFAPFCFFVILGSSWRLLTDYKELGFYVVVGILFYIAFYIFLFPENYYGGKDSVGNRYFLQILPMVSLLVSQARLNTWHIRGLLLASPLLSILFIGHHHLYPTKAYSNFHETGSAQSFMPFEVTQHYLMQYLPVGTPVNMSLLPRMPGQIRVRTNSYLFDSDREVFVEYDAPFANVEAPIFNRRSILGFDVFASPGIHLSESWGVWSRKRSEIVFDREKKMPKQIVLITYPLRNRLIVSSDMLEVTVELSKGKQSVLTLDRFAGNSRFLRMSFSAENSNIPSRVNKSSADNRELSFGVVFSD